MLAECALAAALLAVTAPLAIPLGPIPLSLATAVLCLIGMLLSPLCALASVAVYLVLGAIGLPIFSGFGAGVGVLIGPSGGFLLGYPLCVLSVSIASRLARDRGRRGTVLWRLFGALFGLALLYALGVLWYAEVAGVSFLAALAVSALPFLPFEIPKLALALLLAPRLRLALARIEK